MKGRFARVPPWIAGTYLSPQAWQVLIVICAHIGPTGWSWPSLTTIATLTRVIRNNVPRIINELESAGVLHRDRSTSGGKGHSTCYQVVLNDPRTSSVDDDVSRQTASPSDDVYTLQTSSKTPPKRHHPVTTRTEKGTEKKDSERAPVCEEWREFWAIRPGRGAYPDPETPARREFEAALARGIAAEDIIGGAKVWAAQVAETEMPARFVKTAKNWLKDEGWLDQPRPAPRRRLGTGMF